MSDDIVSMRLLSASFTGRDRVEEFRETYGRALMRLEIEPLPGHPLDLDFTVRAFSGFGLATGRLSPTRNTHTTAMIDDDDLILVVAPQGCGSLHQNGRDVTIEDGGATLIANGAPGVFYGNVTSTLCNFRLQRSLLTTLGVHPDAALVKPIPREHPALRLMTRYASIVNDDEALATPELRQAVALHMHDLAAVLLGATRDGAETANGRGVRAARLRAIKDDIRANLDQRDLSTSAIAARHRVSPRYVNMLFETEGLSVSQFVLTQRLARAHRMLGDPRLAGRTISAIAFDCGFSDLSYFNRTFRREYGVTPSDIREQATRLR